MPDPRILLVTGTDTEVGKTFVSCALAHALSQRCACLAIKPAESGCTPERDGQEDGQRLARATGQDEPTRALTRLDTPVAPPVAAELEGRRARARRMDRPHPTTGTARRDHPRRGRRRPAQPPGLGL